MQKLGVYQEDDSYEVREPGQGIPGNFEQGRWHGNFDTYNEAKAYADAINNSHHPDLTDRLIETHRTLQMSRQYLMGLVATNDAHGIRIIDHLFDAMGHTEQAIKGLERARPGPATWPNPDQKR